MIEMVKTRHEGDKQALRGTADTWHPAPNRDCWINKRNFPWPVMDDRVLKQPL